MLRREHECGYSTLIMLLIVCYDRLTKSPLYNGYRQHKQYKKKLCPGCGVFWGRLHRFFLPTNAVYLKILTNIFDAV